MRYVPRTGSTSAAASDGCRRAFATSRVSSARGRARMALRDGGVSRSDEQRGPTCRTTRSHWLSIVCTMDSTGATVGFHSAGGALSSEAEMVDSPPLARSRTTTLPSSSTRTLDTNLSAATATTSGTAWKWPISASPNSAVQMGDRLKRSNARLCQMKGAKRRAPPSGLPTSKRASAFWKAKPTQSQGNLVGDTMKDQK